MNLLERHQLMQGRNCTAIIDHSTICFNAIAKIKRNDKDNVKKIETLEAIVTRSLFGNINASRNSA